MAIDPFDLVSPLPPGDPNIPANVDGTPPLAGPIGEEWIATVTNNMNGNSYGATMSQLRVALLQQSARPQIVFVTPTSGQTVTSGRPLLLDVSALSAVGIQQVEFFAGSTSLGVAVNAGSHYTLAFTPPASTATVVLTARATDSNGTTETASAIIFPTAAAIARPEVNIVSPVSGTHLVGNNSVVFIATAEDATGIEEVEFFLGTTSLGIATRNNLQYELVYALPAAGGVLNLTARATNANGVTGSATTTILVDPASASQPSITGFVPTSGGPGTVVALTGFNLNAAQTITVAGVAVTGFTVNSATSVLVVVPDFGTAFGRFQLTTPTGIANSLGSFALATAVTVPGAPTNVVATAGNSTVRVEGTPPASNGGAPIISYNVFRNNAGAPVAANVSLPYDDITAINGNEYTYKLQAHNSAGDGPKSAASNAATPSAAVGPTIPGPTYHGAVSTGDPIAASIQAMTAEQWAAGPRTFVVACNGTFPCFAEPASYPVRTIVQDGNPYNITGDITVKTEVLSISGAAIEYRVYTHKNAQYDPAFTESL